VTVGTAADGLVLTAQSPGAWANNYWIAIKNSTLSPGRFRLQVLSVPPGATSYPVVESFENLSMLSPNPQGRYVSDVINNSSSIIDVTTVNGTTPPSDTPTPVPSSALPTPSSLLSATTKGVDGLALTPNSANFESALQPTIAAGSPITGLHLLDSVDLFNLLCVPGETAPATVGTLDAYCGVRRAFYIADTDQSVNSFALAQSKYGSGLGGLLSGAGNNTAFYFPWILAPDPLKQNAMGQFPPSGFVAGMFATTDANRGVWKAPAGTETALVGATGVTVPLNDAQNGVLNPVGLNCIRNFKV